MIPRLRLTLAVSCADEMFFSEIIRFFTWIFHFHDMGHHGRETKNMTSFGGFDCCSQPTLISTVCLFGPSFLSHGYCIGGEWRADASEVGQTGSWSAGECLATYGSQGFRGVHLGRITKEGDLIVFCLFCCTMHCLSTCSISYMFYHFFK